MWLWMLAAAHAGIRADLHTATARAPDVALACTSYRQAMDRITRLGKGMGDALPEMPEKVKVLFQPGTDGAIVDGDAPLTFAMWKESHAMEFGVETARSAESVAQALASASSGTAIQEGVAWVVRNRAGEEIRVHTDGGYAHATFGTIVPGEHAPSRAIIDVLPDAAGCGVVAHIDTDASGPMDVALHIPFTPNTPLSFAAASPKLEGIAGVAPRPGSPVAISTVEPQDAVLVLGIGLDGINFSRFLDGKDLRTARRAQRYFPITSGTVVGMRSAEPLPVIGVALPLARHFSAKRVAKRARNLLKSKAEVLPGADATHFTATIGMLPLYFAAKDGMLLAATGPATLAHMEAGGGEPWVQGEAARMAKQYPLVLVSSVMPGGKDGAPVRRMDPPATFALALDEGLIRGEMLIPMTLDEFATLAKGVADERKARKAPGRPDDEPIEVPIPNPAPPREGD